MVQLFLARLLAPAEFGLIAMVAVFIAISTNVMDAGFGRALIQRKEINDREISTVFYFNLLSGVAMMAVLFSIAPVVADFYEQPALREILRWLSLSLLLGSAGGVHATLLGRNMQFKKLFWVSFPATLFAGIIGIVFAFLGYGVWALVIQMISLQSFRSLALWFQTGWRPLLVFDVSALKSLFPFGSRLALSAIIASIFDNIYVLVIGKVFSPASVGFFQRARSFQQMPVSLVQSILGRVTFPLFASIQDDPVRLKRGMSKAIQLGSFFSITAMAGMAAVAEPMVVTLIGEKWMPSVPLLQVLCLGATLYPLHALNLDILMALGHSKLYLRLEIIKKGVVLLNILLTYRFGVQAMVYGIVVVSFACIYVNAYYTKKYIHYGMLAQLRDLLPTVGLSIVMFVIVSAFIGLDLWQAELQLIGGVVLGGLIVLMGLRYLREDLKSEMRAITHKLPYGKWASRMLLPL